MDVRRIGGAHGATTWNVAARENNEAILAVTGTADPPCPVHKQ